MQLEPVFAARQVEGDDFFLLAIVFPPLLNFNDDFLAKLDHMISEPV